MSLLQKSSFAVTGVGICLLLFAFSVWSGGCTLGDCGDQREICVDGEPCFCADKCSTDKNCLKYIEDENRQKIYLEQCFAYEYSDTHGVCVSLDFMAKHGGPSESHPNGRHLSDDTTINDDDDD